MQVFHQLWHDQRGFTVSTELVFVTTMVVIGLIVGLATYRDAVVDELADTAIAVSALDQSYSYTTSLPAGPYEFGHIDAAPSICDPWVTVSVSVGDSSYTDNNDFCDHIAAGAEGSSIADQAGQSPACIEQTTATAEGT